MSRAHSMLFGLLIVSCAGCRETAKQGAPVSKDTAASDKQAEEKRNSEPAPVPPALIAVHIDGNFMQETNPNPNQFRLWVKGGPWVYVDEKLVATMDRTRKQWYFDLNVKPGPHRVGICFVHFNGPDYFPFKFDEYPVTAQRGEPVGIRSFVDESGTHLWWPAYAAIRRDEVAQHLRRLEMTIQTRLDQIKLDLLIRAMDRVLADVKKKPPASKVVWLEIPEKYGGPREVDASQVSILIDWLKRRYWDDLADPKGPLGPVFLGQLTPELLGRLQAMQTVIEAGRSAFDEFRAIPRALELAED